MKECDNCIYFRKSEELGVKLCFGKCNKTKKITNIDDYCEEWEIDKRYNLEV